MSSDAVQSADPLVVEPVASGFEYTVRLNVAIPLAWAKVLKTTGEHHYDYKCREMAECGVVNGLHNTALFNEDPEFKAKPSTHPISWRDCDGMLKIMEQAHYVFDLVVIGQIRAWLRRTMEQIEARHHEIAQDPGVISAISEAIARAKLAKECLSRPRAVEVLGTQAAVAEQMIESAEVQLRSALTVIGDNGG